MHVVLANDVEISSIQFEGDTVPHCTLVRSKKKLTATHVVVADVLQAWFKGFSVHDIEQNFVISCNVQSIVAWEIVYEASFRHLTVAFPPGPPCMLIVDHLEEQNGTWALDHESPLIKQIHLPQVFVSDSVKVHIVDVLQVDGES